MVGVSSLGYLGFEVSRLDEWEEFATKVLGLGVAERGAGGARGAIALRLDDYRQRIVLEEGAADDLAFIGWEVQSREGLEALRRRLEEAGVAVAEASPDEAAARRVAGLVRFTDPNGVATELFHGPELAPEPFS